MNSNIVLPTSFKGVHIHFVGIKGTGMAAFVEILFHNGAIITGSDISEWFYTDDILEKLGIVPLSFSKDNISSDIDFVVYSAAYKLDSNPDLIEATQKKIPCLLYTQALGQYSERAFSCGICGVHGKTSTTGLVGTILREIDLPSQVLAGSLINSFGNSCTFTSSLLKNQNIQNEQKIFVAETCEYQRHFMSFCPKKIILTSVESDHEDCFPTFQSILDAFVDYVLKLPKNGELIYCVDDKGASEVANIVKQKRPDINFIEYGQNANNEWKIHFISCENGKNKFKVDAFDENFTLLVPGKHEVLDSVAAICLVSRLLNEFGRNPQEYINNIKTGLFNFVGGKRRSEIVGKGFINLNEVIVIDDYAHHPTAIKTTLDGFRSFYKNKKIIVDFMSHTYSRTQALLDEFASSFDSADQIILHEIYSSARENPKDFDITGYSLYEKVLNNYKKTSFSTRCKNR